MLKLQPTLNVIPNTRSKCGEIFCHSSKEFTIFCTFCEMKSFHFDDFILHIQNVHLKYELEKTSRSEVINNNLKFNVKNDNISERTWNVLCNNGEQSSSVNGNTFWDNFESSLSNYSDDNTDSWEEENLKVLKKRTRKISFKKTIENKQIDTAGKLPKEKQSEFLKDINETLPIFSKKSKMPEYICTECHEKFLHKKYLDQHVRDLHNGYKCSLCDKRFSRTSHVECHLKTHTTEKNFICPMEYCGRGFIDENYLKRHLEVHTMERNFICRYDDCGKAFQTQRRLASHEYYHRISKKFVCDMCGYSCRSNPQLITHLRVHTGEKPFPCEVCTKPFISKIALQEHMISHSKTRPHVCSICNRGFANRRVLVRHSFIHSDEKTFKCKLCESSFKHPNSLQGHIRYVHRKANLRPA